MNKEPWKMNKKEFGRKSKEFYNKYGNDLWLASKYHSDITQETHNENMLFNIKGYAQYHRQFIKQALQQEKIPYKNWEKDYPELVK